MSNIEHDAQHDAQEVKSGLRAHIAAAPLTSVLAALAVGFLTALLLPHLV